MNIPTKEPKQEKWQVKAFDKIANGGILLFIIAVLSLPIWLPVVIFGVVPVAAFLFIVYFFYKLLTAKVIK